MKYSWEEIKVGDSFVVEGGGNEHGAGKQIVVAHKVTKQNNVFCYKVSFKGKLLAKNHKLDRNKIVRSFPFKMFLDNDISSHDADRLEEVMK
tara:strand:- start:62 stop:337 length:276 start_codon:yes stop_codon:yes gene_type:complete